MFMEDQPKSWRESCAERKVIVMPPMTNHHHTMFGGYVLALIDETAASVAAEHCGSTSIVTASMDSVTFYGPVKLGQFVHLEARLLYTGHSSMEIEVRVWGKEPGSPERRPICTAYTTFVRVDPSGKPVPNVPPLLLETEEDRRLFKEAKARKEARLAKK